MKRHEQKLFKPLETFLMNDQPFTCPQCGSRCLEIARFDHTNSKRFIQQCLNNNCMFVCFEEEDEYYLKLWE
jgi:transcription elongation factor Elf1